MYGVLKGMEGGVIGSSGRDDGEKREECVERWEG